LHMLWSSTLHCLALEPIKENLICKICPEFVFSCFLSTSPLVLYPLWAACEKL
jgi:hypothetical protein